MHLNPINVLIFFGILQSVIISILIVSSSSFKNAHARILILLLVVVSISLLPTFLGNSGLVQQFHMLAFTPLHLELFIFPVAYLYIKSIFDNTDGPKANSISHFIFPGIYWVYSLFIWLTTITYSAGKGLIAGKYFYFEVYSLYPVMMVLVAGFYAIRAYHLVKISSESGLSKNQKKFYTWLKALAILFVLGYSLDVTSVFLGQIYGHWRGTAFDEWLGIPFSMLVKLYYAVLVYLVATVGYAKFTQPKIKKSKLLVVQDLLTDITGLMEKEKLYLDTDFALPKMANELDMTAASVSAVLNNELNISFNDFVNKYRVEEVKNKLETGALDKYTLAAVAEEAGFKSKATFYRAFQKFTGQSPKSYLESLMTTLK